MMYMYLIPDNLEDLVGNKCMYLVHYDVLMGLQKGLQWIVLAGSVTLKQ